MVERKELSFKRAIWGYKPKQVYQEIERISKSLADKKQEQLIQLTNAENELKLQQKELEYTHKQIKDYGLQEHSIVDSLTRAQSSATAIEEKAWQESRNIVNNAIKEVEAQKNNLEILKQQYDAFRRDFVSILQRYSSSLIDADSVEKPRLKSVEDIYFNEDSRIS